MTSKVSLKTGSYVLALTLSEQFKISSRKNEAYEMCAAKVLERAVNFVADIAPDLLKGGEVVSSQPRAFIGREEREVLTLERMKDLSRTPMPGDEDYGEPKKIMASEETLQKLEKIANQFEIRRKPLFLVEAQAARMVISAFARLQNAYQAQGEISDNEHVSVSVETKKGLSRDLREYRLKSRKDWVLKV